MDGNPTKYFWAEPDGGADLRLSLPLDCFWEAPGYDSGITVRLSQEGASVRRLTTVRFPVKEIVEHTVKLLVAKLKKHPLVPGGVTLDMPLVVRDSVADLNA